MSNHTMNLTPSTFKMIREGNTYGEDNSDLWENMLWKTYYANQIKEKEKAVVLSCDELTKDLFNNDLGEKHDEMTLRIWGYFKKKTVELVNVGCTVILDWGFWRLENRRSLTDFCHSQNVHCEWHYIEVDDQTWNKNIEDGEGGSDYYLDEGLMGKLLSMWEEPTNVE